MLPSLLSTDAVRYYASPRGEDCSPAATVAPAEIDIARELVGLPFCGAHVAYLQAFAPRKLRVAVIGADSSRGFIDRRVTVHVDAAGVVQRVVLESFVGHTSPDELLATMTELQRQMASQSS